METVGTKVIRKPKEPRTRPANRQRSAKRDRSYIVHDENEEMTPAELEQYHAQFSAALDACLKLAEELASETEGPFDSAADMEAIREERMRAIS